MSGPASRFGSHTVTRPSRPHTYSRPSPPSTVQPAPVWASNGRPSVGSKVSAEYSPAALLPSTTRVDRSGLYEPNAALGASSDASLRAESRSQTSRLFEALPTATRGRI